MDNSITQVSDANGVMEKIQSIIMENSQISIHILQAADEQVAEASKKLDDLAHIQYDLVNKFKV